MEREGTSPVVIVASTSPSSSPVGPVLGPRAPSFHAGGNLGTLLARVSALVDIADAEGQSVTGDASLVEDLRAVFTHERDWTEKAAKLLDESGEKRRQETARADRAEAALRASLSSERA